MTDTLIRTKLARLETAQVHGLIVPAVYVAALIGVGSLIVYMLQFIS